MVALAIGTASGASAQVAPAIETTTAPASATDNPAAPSVPAQVTEQASDEIVVTGFRQSLQNAQAIKRNASEIVDSIVAEDIGKLPDNNIAEALQRIPGIQITRNNGEGSGIAIRGLTQVKTLLNGREIFSDAGRDLALENVPAEILAGVDVYKNPSATLIEGGLGGVVNLKTRRPFDFKGFTASVSARANYYDLIKKTEPQFSGLISDRFDTGAGEIGVLLGAAYLKSASRIDAIGLEPFNDRCNIVDFNGNGSFPGGSPSGGKCADAGDRVISPNGGGVTAGITNRERLTLNGIVQWRPASGLELYVESIYNRYDYKSDSYSNFANRGALLPASGVPFTFYEGTNLVKSGAYRNVSFTENTNFFDRLATTWQTSGGGEWKATDRLKLTTDITYTKARTDARNGGIRIGNANPTTNGPTLTFDTSTSLPTLILSGVSTNPADYFAINSSQSRELLRGSSLAARFDGSYQTDGPVTGIDFGMRYAGRKVDRQQGTTNHIPNGATQRPISLISSAFGPGVLGNFFSDTDVTNLFDIPTPPISVARDQTALCAALSDPICVAVFNPLVSYKQDEKTYAVYGQFNFKFDAGPIPIDGNAGGRFVRTDLSVNGFRTVNSGEGVPINQKSSYDSYLPSVNIRGELLHNFYLRLAAAKQLTRPSFADLAPTLNLGIQTAIGLTGSAGNPDLRPLRSRSFDASFEWYFSRSGYAYLSGFLKKVDGFIQRVEQEEAVSLAEFPTFTTARINRPQNGANGTIKGFEVGGQLFFDFLPKPLDGFGVQANYTYVDSQAPGPIVGTVVPLIGLSKNNINTVLFYEKGPFRARMAYNWRDDYVDTTSGPGSGSLPIYAAPTGFLDASIGYNFNDHLDVSLDASNLTRTKVETYFGERNRPRFINQYDTRYGIVARVKF